jgi:hypothetical protein
MPDAILALLANKLEQSFQDKVISIARRKVIAGEVVKLPILVWGFP